MARLEIIVQARSALSLGAAKGYGGTLIESGHYITGGHLRGALGAVKPYLSQNEQKQIDQLLRPAAGGGICFPNCYPAKERPAYPAPLTVQECKSRGGWMSDKDRRLPDEKKKRHGIADMLLRQLANDQLHKSRDHWSVPLPFLYRCPVCGGRTENYPGLIEYVGKKPVIPAQSQMHRQTRVAINRSRLTAEEGQLYTVQAFDEDCQFIGVMEVEGEDVMLVQDWLPKIERVGGRVSRGFGRVSVTVKNAARPGLDTEERLTEFNERYQKMLEELYAIAHKPPALDQPTIFTINLRSDLLLMTEDGAPTLRLDATLLRAAACKLMAGADFDQLAIRLVAQYTQPTWVSGWQTARRSPKEALLGVRGGGLYVFTADLRDGAGKRAALLNLLEGVERMGLGEWREDGYGQIAACDPFHLEVEPV